MDSVKSLLIWGWLYLVAAGFNAGMAVLNWLRLLTDAGTDSTLLVALLNTVIAVWIGGYGFDYLSRAKAKRRQEAFEKEYAAMLAEFEEISRGR